MTYTVKYTTLELGATWFYAEAFVNPNVIQYDMKIYLLNTIKRVVASKRVKKASRVKKSYS